MATNVKQTREKFIEQFGRPTFNAVVTIAKTQAGRKVPKKVSGISPRSLAAYRANLTRGAYKPFVTATKSGKISDRMDLVNVR